MNAPLVRLLTAREVAEQGYRATMKGKPVCINGMGNRLVESLSRHQPRWVLHRLGKILVQRTN
jgi:short-subunit dehydrogenase